MPDSTSTGCDCARACSTSPYCDNCDLLIGLDGCHVLDVDERGKYLLVSIESPPAPLGCPACGVVAESHGRRTHTVIDAPCFSRPVLLRWRKRTGTCLDPGCVTKTFTERADDHVAAPPALLSKRACWWAIGQIRRESASVQGIARQLGTTWNTVWTSIKPLLQAMADDPARFDGVTDLGVDEHIWHHMSPNERGPKELTGMVDLTRTATGRVNARLLDLVPGRSGTVYKNWLNERGGKFTAGIKVATLDPFHGYKNAIDDELQDATAVLDAFHVVKLGGQAVDEVRRRVQQQTLGHRGRRGDPQYGVRTILHCGKERITDRQKARLKRAIAADERHDEVYVAWQATQ